MNKIFKWILGLFPALGGILTAIVLGSKKNKKVKKKLMKWYLYMVILNIYINHIY